MKCALATDDRGLHVPQERGDTGSVLAIGKAAVEPAYNPLALTESEMDWDWNAISVHALAVVGLLDLVMRGAFSLVKTFLVEYYDLKSLNKRFRL